MFDELVSAFTSINPTTYIDEDEWVLYSCEGGYRKADLGKPNDFDFEEYIRYMADFTEISCEDAVSFYDCPCCQSDVMDYYLDFADPCSEDLEIEEESEDFDITKAYVDLADKLRGKTWEEIVYFAEHDGGSECELFECDSAEYAFVAYKKEDGSILLSNVVNHYSLDGEISCICDFIGQIKIDDVVDYPLYSPVIEEPHEIPSDSVFFENTISLIKKELICKITNMFEDGKSVRRNFKISISEKEIHDNFVGVCLSERTKDEKGLEFSFLYGSSFDNVCESHDYPLDEMSVETLLEIYKEMR